MKYLFSMMILALFLAGCSDFKHNKQDSLCCYPDEEFTHSCDGWTLCEPYSIIEETEL